MNVLNGVSEGGASSNRKQSETYPPPVHDPHPIRNCLVCFEVHGPLIEPWPIGISGIIIIIVTFGVRVIKVQATSIVARIALADTSGIRCCVLVEVIILLHELIK